MKGSTKTINHKNFLDFFLILLFNFKHTFVIIGFYPYFLEFVERRCDSEGNWKGKMTVKGTAGSTNYTSCIIPGIRNNILF
jgi:hypothetical protein